ncbi:MAG TPA: hypothetical protein VIK71_02125 [Flavobacteriales bacterium]
MMKQWWPLIMLPLMIVFIGASCGETTNGVNQGQKRAQPVPSFKVMFYNVENLFDIYDDPKTKDDDYTENGKLNWTIERYEDKLAKIAYVIDALPDELPAFIGLAEVENRKVLEDLVQQSILKDAGYVIVHEDSPDDRGIDVAALIDTSRLQLLDYRYTRVNLPVADRPNTRDLLYVKCGSGDELLHFYVNHWPSRGGGQQETEPRRVAVANVLHSQIRKMLQQDKDARIIVMGDFNDHPTDKSIATVLDAGISKNNFLYNYMFETHVSGKGSYWYRGEWGALDQFITSPGVKFARKGYVAEQAYIYSEPTIMFRDKSGQERPNRTYAGDKYTGGYSDHLPIYMELVYR